MRTMENHNEDEGGKEAEDELNAKKMKNKAENNPPPEPSTVQMVRHLTL